LAFLSVSKSRGGYHPPVSFDHVISWWEDTILPYGNIFAFCHISVWFAVFKDEEKTADKLNFFIFSLSKQKNL